jgi:hypothetical protein
MKGFVVTSTSSQKSGYGDIPQAHQRECPTSCECRFAGTSNKTSADLFMNENIAKREDEGWLVPASSK